MGLIVPSGRPFFFHARCAPGNPGGIRTRHWTEFESAVSTVGLQGHWLGTASRIRTCKTSGLSRVRIPRIPSSRQKLRWFSLSGRMRATAGIAYDPPHPDRCPSFEGLNGTRDRSRTCRNWILSPARIPKFRHSSIVVRGDGIEPSLRTNAAGYSRLSPPGDSPRRWDSRLMA